MINGINLGCFVYDWLMKTSISLFSELLAKYWLYAFFFFLSDPLDGMKHESRSWFIIPRFAVEEIWCWVQIILHFFISLDGTSLNRPKYVLYVHLITTQDLFTKLIRLVSMFICAISLYASLIGALIKSG